MQGHVTKIINFKPQGFLGLIEEASGTSLYKTKREQTLALLKKKELKIEETNRMLSQEVEPQFERLRDEKRNFDNYNALMDNITKKEKVLVAF